MFRYFVNSYDTSLVSGRFWMDCLNGLKISLEKRDTAIENSHKHYEDKIIQKAVQITEQQQEHNKNLLSEKHQQKIKIASQWLLTKRKLSSDRAVWANRWDVT